MQGLGDLEKEGVEGNQRRAGAPSVGNMFEDEAVLTFLRDIMVGCMVTIALAEGRGVPFPYDDRVPWSFAGECRSGKTREYHRCLGLHVAG